MPPDDGEPNGPEATRQAGAPEGNAWPSDPSARREPAATDGEDARRSERERASTRRGSGEPDGTASGGAGSGGSKGGGASLEKQRKKWRAAFFVLAGVGILGAVAWALLGSRFLVVRVITVSGTHMVSQAQVISAADVPAGTPLIRVDPAQVAARIEAIQQVASARVTKQWPDGLAITVRERVPVVAVKMASGGYDLVDHDGVIVRWLTAKPAAMPLLQTTLSGLELRGNPGVSTVAQVVTGLPLWLSRQVSSIAVSGSTVTLYLTGSRTVVWGGPDRAGAKASELAILMRDPARYYDVSAPGTVVTR